MLRRVKEAVEQVEAAETLRELPNVTKLRRYRQMLWIEP